ncbi:hypothetical protein CALCODRAFT_498670 [Calocera cornea HHB12733]|uniref:GATA-type domain-containing protein n=1 Tax=Calocera cornea HHB12733 TaxID=1353952 RepID=A0A165ES81_9BASI|nr:hypothetical protein CALCODRAFT_498670 [Calocera cornea HHB12733]
MALAGVRKFALEPVKQVRIEVGTKRAWEEDEQRLKDEQAAKKGDEDDDDEDEDMDGSDGEAEEREKPSTGLRSIGDSYLLLQSLRQSRYTILTSFFLKFSSKSKAKNAPEITQPPHTLEYLGKCDVELGPHTFTGTKFFQVNYTPDQRTHGNAHAAHGQQPQAGQAQWSYSAQKGWQGYAYHQQPATPVQLPPGAPGHGLSLTPELIQQVEAAAAADPELAHIRYLAAQNQASTEQLHKLGTLIQEIDARNTAKGRVDRTTPAPVPAPALAVQAAVSRPSTSQAKYAASSAAMPAPAYQAPGYYVPSRKPDIIFEFRENPTERWLLPCDNSIVERRAVGQDGLPEAVLSTFLHAVDPAATAAKEKEDLEAKKREERRRKKEEKKERDRLEKEKKAQEEVEAAAKEAEAQAEVAKEDKPEGRAKPHGKETRSKDKEKKEQVAAKEAEKEKPPEPEPEVETPKETAKAEKEPEKKKVPPKLLPATIHFLDVPDPLWATLLYCSNVADPAQLAHRTTVFDEMLLSSAPRTYPRLRLPNGPLPDDLEEAIADKFAAKPFNPKDRTAFALASPTSGRFNIGPNGQPLPDKPKERKLVSNTWKDGTPRWCQHCGTRETIAWRRGPDGPGTLCQSCGSKFKSKPDLFKLPEEPWTVEKVLEKEIVDKAAKVAAEAEAARKAAELAANPPPPPPPPEPKAPKQRKSSAKGELEPWSAYSHRDLGVQPIAAATVGQSVPEGSTTATLVPPGQVEDTTQITPRYRYASVWQDENGQSRYSESQTPAQTPPTKKARKSKDRASSSSDGRTYAHPTSGYHYDSRYGWYDYSRGQWLQPHQYAQMHTLGRSPPETPGQSGSPGTPATHPYYNDPYYQAYYRNYQQGQYSDPRWAAWYAQYGDPSKAGDPYPPGTTPQPYRPYYSGQPPAEGLISTEKNGDSAQAAEALDGTPANTAEDDGTTEPADKAASHVEPADDPMDDTHSAEIAIDASDEPMHEES